ncbi:hypothetical protein Q5P01_002670 [Channa striata]|uniref:Uncharacterized protein n=1 Tax=Channa striata TaxID=64152 RepID=A0AA88NN20_CHASR|nr:hypothetical protein Q5P01_002670 [Channa striata]
MSGTPEWCVLPLLDFYLLPEEISAVVFPSSFTSKREIDWMDQELLAHLPDHSDQGDLSVGDAGETARDVDVRPSETLLASTEDLPLQHQQQNQFHFQHKVNEKRRKVDPVDSIGSFQMSNLRNQKDEQIYQD